MGEGSVKLVIRKSHFISISLLALAFSISLTEYVMYSPVLTQDASENDLLESFSSFDNAAETETENSATDSDQNTSDKTSEQLSSDQDAQVSQETTSDLESASEQFENERKIKINKGDTIASVLEKAGFEKTEVYLASKALSKVFNLRNLKVGQELLVRGEKQNDELQLQYIELKPDVTYKIAVSRDENGNFKAERKDIPIKKVIRNVSGSLSPNSPSFSLKQCGVKDKIAAEALRALNQVVNLKTSKSNVDFEFVYAEAFDNEGNLIPSKTELLYASALINGNIKKVYKFKDQQHSEYIDSKGTILSTVASSKSMLTQPIDRMKVTSKFGYRVHPISGKWKGHTGVDLSAPIGTPVRAAASGVIQKASKYSGYGKYINIKHTASINTAYGHLSRISVRPGQHVHQGQIIGYTGNSGHSTGPHLHYEVIKNGKPVNPLMFVKQEPQKLTGKQLKLFNQQKREINLQVVGLTQSVNGKKKTVGNIKKYS